MEKDMIQEKSVLDLLLEMEPQKPRTKKLKHKRFSEIIGKPVLLTIKQLGYSRVAELKRMDEETMNIHTVLAGQVEPNMQDKRLMEKYKAVTPEELVKKMYLPGEVEDIAREIEKLSGYRVNTLEDMEKKPKKSQSSTSVTGS